MGQEHIREPSKLKKLPKSPSSSHRLIAHPVDFFLWESEEGQIDDEPYEQSSAEVPVLIEEEKEEE